MIKQPVVCWLLWTSMCGAVLAAERGSVDSALPPVSLAFSLTAVDGSAVNVAPQADRQFTVVCFLGTECPLVRLYGPRLEKLAQTYAGQGVRFVGIDSNTQDSPDELRAFVKEHSISFPVAKDPGQKIADLFDARRTPEVFVLDQQLAVIYHGRVDDQFHPGVSRREPTRDDLRLALEEALAGKSVSVSQTEISGCLIGRMHKAEPESKVTFHQQVAAVLDRNCVECHRVGEIGPFALTEYEEVIGWGETLLETIDAGRMPPWHANPAHGSFANARTMAESDKQILRDWVHAGMPRGEASSVPVDAAPVVDQAEFPKPDLIVDMRDRPFVVPADGTVEYQYFVVDPKFTEEKWVSLAQVLPGNRAVVHHAIVFIRPPDGTNYRGIGWLTGYVPGQRNLGIRPGYARRVPAGSKFVFQMHYTPNGVEHSDLTRIGMNFIPAEEVTHEMTTLVGLDQEFEIPPQADSFPVKGSVRRLPTEGELLAIAPHMHVRGKAFQVATRSQGQEEILLDIPRYDFNWQHLYELTTPLDLAKIDGLDFMAMFDNSSQNPANPDPTQFVTWGDQTWEEMAIVFFEVALPVERDAEGHITTKGSSRLTAGKHDSPAEKQAEATDQTALAEAFLQDFLKRFDRNHDGIVDKSETPLAFKHYGFRGIDTDQDGRLTAEEIRAAARNPKGH